MTIAAKVTPVELVSQVTDRFVGGYFVVKLLNSSGLAYTPGLQDPLQYVIDYEIPRQSGYLPQIFGYATNDVNGYADGGVGLKQKQVIFEHDGGETGYTFDAISVQWADGVMLQVEPSTTIVPGPMVDGDYTNVPVDSVVGDGSGLSVNFTVFNGAAVAMEVQSRGFGYTVTDDLQISSGTLASIGAHDGSGGALGVNIVELYLPTNAGSVVLIAPTANTVTLQGGNESAVYFNYKNFGFYSS